MRTYVAESCDVGSDSAAPGTLNSPPSKHVVRVGVTAVDQACGLVVYEIFTPEHMAAFARDICGAADGTISDECSKRFIDMFMARLAERYTAVDWSAVNQKCRAYPLECKDSVAVERLLLAAHNVGVQAWYQEALQAARMNAYRAAQETQLAYQRTEQMREAEHRERRQRIGAALEAMGKALEPKPVIRCTSTTSGQATNYGASTTYGGTTHTRCQ